MKLLVTKIPAIIQKKRKEKKPNLNFGVFYMGENSVNQ